MQKPKRKPVPQKIIFVAGSRETVSSILDSLREFKAPGSMKFIAVYPSAIKRLKLTVAARDSFKKLDTYDWIFFSSKNAVRFFMFELRKRHLKIGQTTGPGQTKNKIKIAAVGPETAASLEAEGVTVNFVPKQFSTEALIDGLGSELKGKNILFPRSAIAPQDMLQKITGKGAHVDVMDIYTNVTIPIPSSKLKLIEKGFVEIIVFTSPSVIEGFLKQAHPMPEIVLYVPVICIGPSTEKSARASGFKNIAVSKNATGVSVAKEVLRLLGRKG
jgi:uroporphyrinogen-III synthase